MEKKYEVSGLHCKGCVNILKDELSEIEGLKSAEVSQDFKILTVTGDVPDERIKQGVIDAGYEFIKKL